MENNNLQIITSILKPEPFNITQEVSKNTEIKSLPGWDSLKHLTFLVEVEKQWDIEIEPEDAAGMITLGDLLQYIEKQ